MKPNNKNLQKQIDDLNMKIEEIYEICFSLHTSINILTDLHTKLNKVKK